MYMYVGIEISNRCNARCPWCFTTKVADGIRQDQAEGFMGIDTFTAVIERLETLGLLHDEVVINLYAIGEPFLNRDIRKVFSYLNEKGLKFAISTNASTPVLFEEGSDILRNLTSLIISLPGFSEESYKRVYGFQFNRIQNNIVSLVNNFR
ncbi:MAG: radical SAM protein, partial [Dehalococcoidia bacterium]|nr:radical SAM protein [Dehalococcoidia bacterium]